MKRVFLYLILVILIVACATKNVQVAKNGDSLQNKFLPKDFKSFCYEIDRVEGIDESKKMINIEGDAPAALKYIEANGGVKYLIAYTGSLGKRTIRYFFKEKNIYIEDIEVEYNKIFNYKEDTTKFRIIKQDTSKYFVENLKLIRFCDPSGNVVKRNQITSELSNKSKNLLKHLEMMKQHAAQ